MAVNKVKINGEVKLDLTADTVTHSDLKKGVTAHSKSGAVITGTLEVPDQQTKTVELSMASGNQVISPDSGKFLSEVTVNKPDTLIPANIKKDVVIGGVTGTMEASAQSETWVWNETITAPETAVFYSGAFTFVYQGKTVEFTTVRIAPQSSTTPIKPFNMRYIGKISSSSVNISAYYSDEFGNEGWGDNAYRKITFLEPPTGDFLVYLQANAVKQPSDSALQPSKSLTVTSNGTVSITPDAPYDAMEKVDLTVNVAGSGGSGHSVTFPEEIGNSSIGASLDPVFNIIHADGTLETYNGFSGIAGKTFQNVLSLNVSLTGYYIVFKMTLGSGRCIVYNAIAVVSQGIQLMAPGDESAASMGSGNARVFSPVEDIVISSCRFYDTD